MIKTKKTSLLNAIKTQFKTKVKTDKEWNALALAGKIFVNEQRITSLAQKVDLTSDVIRFVEQEKYVGRGGDKLYGSIEDFGLLDDFKGATILDVGGSTGGFTDCALQLGAKKVVVVDVGTNQLAWKIRSHPQVEVFEKTDIRNFKTQEIFDWILIDVSFISLSTIAKSIFALSKRDKTKIIALIKPQFELDVGLVPKGGVVVDNKDREFAFAKIKAEFENLGLKLKAQADSKIKGHSGNSEIFGLFYHPF